MQRVQSGNNGTVLEIKIDVLSVFEAVYELRSEQFAATICRREPQLQRQFADRITLVANPYAARDRLA